MNGVEGRRNKRGDGSGEVIVGVVQGFGLGGAGDRVGGGNGVCAKGEGVVEGIEAGEELAGGGEGGAGETKRARAGGRIGGGGGVVIGGLDHAGAEGEEGVGRGGRCGGGRLFVRVDGEGVGEGEWVGGGGRGDGYAA